MRILIVYAHPSTKSFTYQVLNQLKQGLLDAGHLVEVSDLYASGFMTDLSKAEYEGSAPEGAEFSCPSDVLTEQTKLDSADCVCLIYPVWWSDCPAKLKGWFDRVFSLGYAYSYSDAPRKMKTKAKGIVICTAGHSNVFLEDTGIAESMRKVMLEDRLGNRFLHKEMIILGGTLEGENLKKNHLLKVYQIGKEIETI